MPSSTCTVSEMREKLTAWFKSQVGVTEKNHDNNVIYNTHYYGREVSDRSGSAYAWCLAFIWDGFRECGLSELFMGGRKSAYCPELVNWAKAAGKWVTGDYREGDIVFFDWNGDALADHAGYVVSAHPLCAVEGNYGDRVAAVERRAADIMGAYRPEYGEKSDAESFETVPAARFYDFFPPELSFGMKSAYVWAMQALLRTKGEKLSVDGEFGEETLWALLHFQRSHALDADGICGMLTWGALMKGE